MQVEEKYMRRALQLARKGYQYASPNPMVGAVIVGPDGKILGEGYHRRCGEGHAEVNAVASVADKAALADSTMYVTLEPCAHYGRTGPCAQLIIDHKIPRVVVGARDPFDKVDGRGIDMLRSAGVEVVQGVLADESRSLNAIFFTAHTQRRPFVMLKWAESADGYIDSKRSYGQAAAKISTPVTSALVHRLRSRFDAILVGSGTVLADNPGLDTRLWAGRSPRPVILDRRGRIGHDFKVMARNPIVLSAHEPLAEAMSRLYAGGITSVLVEGGAQVLGSFISQGLWDVARVETSAQPMGDGGAVKALVIPPEFYVSEEQLDGNTVRYYSKNSLADVKNL